MNASWATRQLFKFPPGVAKGMKIIAIVALFLLPVSPAIVALGWHLIHGNTIETRGKKVFVPPRWIAWTDHAMDVGITKLPLTIFRGGVRRWNNINWSE
jgi:hypothetical protein